MKKFINLAVLLFVGTSFGAERNNNLNEFPRRNPFINIAGQNREQDALIRQEAVRRGMNEEQIAVLFQEIAHGQGLPAWFLRGELAPNPRFALNIPDHINNHLLPRDPAIRLVRRNLLPAFNQVQPVEQAMQNLAVNNDDQAMGLDEDLAQQLPPFQNQENNDDMDVDDRQDDQPAR